MHFRSLRWFVVTLAGACLLVVALALVAYAVGLLQWLLVRLPKQGRVAGEF